MKDLQLCAFPFDDLRQPIAMELAPDSLSSYPSHRYGCFSLVVDKDSNPRTLGRHVGISGYSLLESESQELLHPYTSNLGHIALHACNAVKTNLLY
jgi:hypothetical protein